MHEHPCSSAPDRPSGCTHKELCPRIERVADRLFEGEESVLHLMG
jgi:hypothetical protein